MAGTATTPGSITVYLLELNLLDRGSAMILAVYVDGKLFS